MSCFFRLQSSNSPTNTKQQLTVEKQNKQKKKKNSYFPLAEKMWQIFHGCNPHNQLFCSSHKCKFLTNVVPFKKEIIQLSDSMRFMSRSIHISYNKKLIHQAHISFQDILGDCVSSLLRKA